MSDISQPKTLKLRKKPGSDERDITAPRQRTGARARNVAMQQKEHEKRAEVKAPKPVTPVSKTPLTTGQHAASTPRPASRPHAKHRTQRSQPYAAEIFPVFTPCPQGLEEALALELQALGFEEVKTARSGCSLRTNWTGILRLNLYSRLATRVLVQVAHGPVHHEDDILELAQSTPWERWFGAEQTLRVDTSAIRSPMQSLQYCNLRAKDGICDRLRDREGARPDIDTVRPDARVHLFLTEDTGTLYLDTSGESLFKRGWRFDKGEAPIRENLAAGILALSDWDPATALLDPFCGSGTILIEAAWIARGIPPGIWRPFGFERLRNHDARHWNDLKDDAHSAIDTEVDTILMGVDLDPSAIAASQRNLEQAGLSSDAVRFETGDAQTVMPPAEHGSIVTNPPYGERLEGESDEMWSHFAQNMKRNFAGWRVNIISSDFELPQKMRLKPHRRFPLYNGPLDCRLFSFDMVSSGYRR